MDLSGSGGLLPMITTKKKRERVRSRKRDGTTPGSTPTSTDIETHTPRTSWYRRNIWLLAIVGFLTLLLFIAYQLLSLLFFLRIFTLLPVSLCIYPTIQSGKKFHQKIIPVSLILAVVSAQLPSFLASAIAVVSVVMFTLITEPSVKNRETTDAKQTTNRGPGFATALASIMLMISVLLVENFLIWVVSATFPAGQNLDTAPPPLQDNGQLFMKHLMQSISKRNVISLRRMWNTQWALVACFAASLLVAEKYNTRRTLFSVASRATITVAIARSIRTVSFLLTVLPSQVPACYNQRFPNPPPTDVWEWIYVGLQPRSHGGCNDLIISGHATITCTFACVATSLAQNWWFAVALWSMVVLDYSIEIYEGFHYSVDMWLGMVVVALTWQVMGFIERNLDEKSFMTKPKPISMNRALLFSPPAIVTYLQMTILPEATANFVILAFVLVGLVMFVRCVWNEEDQRKQRFFTHYVQHTFLCLLVLALGVYL